MAFFFLLRFSLLIILFSPLSHSLKCTSQRFTNNKLYKNCTDLPTLDSYLHYTYDAKKSSLSVAFIASPPKSDGWIGWGINPNGTGMAGTQALIAFKKSDGKMNVKTYNLVSYSSIVQSKISFDVSDSSAEYSDGVMTIFATLALPENMTVVNQVWQVGASVDNDFPAKHAFKAENLNAKGELKLAAEVKNSTSPTSAPSNTTTSAPTSSGNDKDQNNSSRIGDRSLYLVLFFFIFGILAL